MSVALSPPTRAIIAFGANSGRRRAAIRDGLRALDAVERVRVCRVSRFLENPPAEGTAGGPFINGAVLVETTLPAAVLLEKLHEIEARAGRPRRRAPGLARPLDLDLVYYGDSVCAAAGLCLPHPRRLGRFFVIVPAAEIAPGFVDPVLGRTLADLRARLFPGAPPGLER